MTTDLSTVRRDLADARDELRRAEDYYHSCRLRAELALIERVGNDPKNVGSNEADRKRAYDIACEGDDDCQRALTALRGQQLTVARLEAERDVLLDLRHDRDVDLRQRELDQRAGAFS